MARGVSGTLLFLLGFAHPAICAAPSGKVVWWGKDDFWTELIRYQTNGVIDGDNEIVSNVVAIAGNTLQGLLLRDDRTVMGAGRDHWGGNEVPPGLSNVARVAVEGSLCWAIRRDGTVVKWGHLESDPRGESLVASLSNVVSIAWAGSRNYLALKKDGTVLGFRFDGQQQVREVLVRGQRLTGVSVLASGYTPLVLKTNGTVWVLDYQTPGAPPVEPTLEVRDNTVYENLGGESAKIPYEYASIKPVIIDGRALTNVTALASGGRFALALKEEGTVVAWGDTADDPATVPMGLSNVVAIAATEMQSMALRSDGTVVAWGDNSEGQTSVPLGLSNVIAIASGGFFNLALTTGNIPSSVYIQPHGRLEEMERDSSLVFKGRVLSSRAITNAGFPYWGKPHATVLEVISVLKGNVAAQQVEFLHLTHGPDAWGGGTPPPDFLLDDGQSYLIFAANADKPDWLYSPSAEDALRTNRFRQVMKGKVPMRTKDNRPLDRLATKEAHWQELNLLLNDLNPTNKLYAIQTLDSMSLAGRKDDWWRSADFRRRDVLRALLPCVTSPDEQVASRAIRCFGTESNAAVVLEPFAGALINVANQSPSTSLRLNAVQALSGTHFQSVSNSLAQLLRDPHETTRWRAIMLLGLFPGEFSEQALARAAVDTSPKVRAAVADVIGSARMNNLLPVLTRLFADPVGKSKPVSPLTIEELEGGLRIVGTEGGVTMVDDPNVPGANVGDVHTSAGYALLKFDLDRVGNILKTNLNEPGFRLQFLLRLAEVDPAPWVEDMAKIMEARRERKLKQAKADGAPPQSYLTLSGAYFECWRVIYGYLEKLAPARLLEDPNDRYLKVLEQAGNTGSQEPVMLYELYKMKGLNQRAAEFRSQNDKYPGYRLDEFFNRVDSKYQTNTANPTN